MRETTSPKLSIDEALLPRGAGARVADIGCGDGRHIAAAARRGCRAIGVDYDAAELRRAGEALRGLHVDLVAADAAHLPFRAAAFDAAICTETLEHLPDDAGALREIARTLRPGALLLGAVPSHFTELAYWRLSRGYHDTPGGHVRIYRPRELIAKLRGAGLSTASMRYVHFIDSLIWLRFCMSDALRRHHPASDFEAAVMLAVAAQRPLPPWRRRLRAALGTSRFVSGIDAAGALIWPKSLLFVARRTSVPVTDPLRRLHVRAGAGGGDAPGANVAGWDWYDARDA